MGRALKIKFLALLGALLLAGCDPPLATNISSSIDRGLVSDDNVRLRNDTGTDYQMIDGVLKLKYADRTDKLTVSWSMWKNGETKAVPVSRGVKGLQTYSLSAGYVGAHGGPDPKWRGNIDASWYAK